MSNDTIIRMKVAPGKGLALVYYVRTERGWRRFPALFAKVNGRVEVRFGWIKDGDSERHIDGGRYQIRKYVNGKQTFVNLGATHPRDIAVEFNAAMQAAPTTRARVADERTIAQSMRSPKALLSKAVDAYTDYLVTANKLEAAEHAKRTLRDLIDHSCKGLLLVRDLTEDCLLNHYQWLRTEGCKRQTKTGEVTGCSERTIHNKHTRIRSFLLWCNVDTAYVMPAAPVYEKKVPEIYDPSQIAAIRAAADDYMRLAIDLCHMLGLREQEAMHATWSDIDRHHSVFKVQGKPEYGFKVKDAEQREIPIPAELLARLKAWHKAHPGTNLIIGTASDSPNGHLLRSLKRLAAGAGLNCGQCSSCRKHVPAVTGTKLIKRSADPVTGQACEQWILHKFRATYLTTLHRSGVDARTVQALAGHSDLETTLKYLKPAGAKELHDKVNAIQWQAAPVVVKQPRRRRSAL